MGSPILMDPLPADIIVQSFNFTRKNLSPLFVLIWVTFIYRCTTFCLQPFSGVSLIFKIQKISDLRMNQI